MNPIIAKLKSWVMLGVGIGLLYAVIFGILFLVAPSWLDKMPMLPREFVLSGTVMFILGMVAYVIWTAILWAVAWLVSYLTIPIGAMFLSKKTFYEVHLWFPFMVLSLLLSVVSGTFSIVPFVLLAVISLLALYVLVRVLKLFRRDIPTI